jgi:3-oxoacyl-[acyl-carrier-protein] synthase II
MNIVVNSLDILDANGTSFEKCLEHYKKGNAHNIRRYEEPLVEGLPRYDIPLSNEDLQLELESRDFKEHYLSRAIKLATLATLRATEGISIPKNTIVIGVTLQAPQDISWNIWKNWTNEKKGVSPRWGAACTQSAICTTISRTLRLTGPSFMVNQACSAFQTAVDIANKYLESKETDMVLIAGVDCVTDPPITTYIFNSMGVITKDKIRPFDKKRSGMAMGEAAFCYVLTREEDAQKRLAKFSDVCVYNDYYHLTAHNPDGTAGKFILDKLTHGFTKKIDAVNCHATATKVGDEAELEALEMFPEPLYIYGLKGSVGHTMATSGGVETAYSITGLREGWIPYTSVTDDVLDTKHKIVLHNILEKETNNFIKLSFGFGGVSTGILVEK